VSSAACLAGVCGLGRGARQPRAWRRDAARRVRRGMLCNPCDVVHKPSSMLGAIRRVAACIPPVTPFVTLERSRRDLDRAREQLQALDVGDDEAPVSK
jgi:hypothetical protein